MAKVKEPFNPFYALVVVAGVVFLVTACGYGTMTYRAIAPRAGAAGQPHPLMTFLDQYGMQLMSGELAVLAAATFGAMWLDRFRSLRAEAAKSASVDWPGPGGNP